MESSVRKHGHILKIGGIILLIIIIGMAFCAYFALHPLGTTSLSYWSLSLTLASVAIVSFFGFMWYLQSLGGQFALNKGGMRLAIVASVITVYLVLVGVVTFFKSVDAVPPMTQTLLTHFTTVVLTVVAFYFGASAYVQVHQKPEKDNSEKLPKDKNTKV